jgi:nucleoside-diphosphate-sugar epimerase
MRVLVTGANGFIGSQVVRDLCARGWFTRRAVRRIEAGRRLPPDTVVVGDLEKGGHWGAAVKDIDSVIHLAGYAHVAASGPSKGDDTFYRVNVEASRNLALAAANAGVRRIVFVSSIGVLGNRSFDSPLTEQNEPNPIGPYACSKLQAEHVLSEIVREQGLELVVVRPPMVYGPGAPGNLVRLMRLIAKGLPLPVPTPPNARSLVGLDNLAAFLAQCVIHPGAAQETFVIADGEDLSTAEIIGHLAKGMGRSVRLIPLPARLIRAVASVLGKVLPHEKIFGSLRIDALKARAMLGWQPVKGPVEGLIETGHAFAIRRRPSVSVDTGLQRPADAFLDKAGIVQQKSIRVDHWTGDV